VRVISKSTVEELTMHVPQAKGTRLYLQASLWIHEPFQNKKFGSPLAVVQVCGEDGEGGENTLSWLVGLLYKKTLSARATI